MKLRPVYRGGRLILFKDDETGQYYGPGMLVGSPMAKMVDGQVVLSGGDPEVVRKLVEAAESARTPPGLVAVTQEAAPEAVVLEPKETINAKGQGKLRKARQAKRGQNGGNAQKGRAHDVGNAKRGMRLPDDAQVGARDGQGQSSG